MNEFFTPSGAPSTGSAGASATMRNELQLVEDGFDKLPAMSTAQGKLLRVNAGGTAIVADVESATIAALAALGTAADKYPYTTGVDTWAEGDITAADAVKSYHATLAKKNLAPKRSLSDDMAITESVLEGYGK